MKAKIIPFKTKAEGIFVELPEEVLIEDVWMNEFYPHFLQFYLTGETFYDRIRLNEHKNARYEPLNFARDIVESECKTIVSGFFNHDNSENFDCWENYHNPHGLTYSCKTALESFHTLMKHMEIDDSTHWLVMIKNYY